MAEYDGSIRIGVILNTDKAKKTLQELRDKLVKQTNDIDAQVKAVQRLEAQYQKLMTAGDNPKGIKKMENDLRKAQEEAKKLDAELQRLQQMAQMDMAANGFVSPDTASRIQEVSAQMAAADARADELNISLEKMRIPPDSTEETKQLKEKIAAANEELEKSKLAAQNTAERIKNLEGASQSWVAKLGQAGSRLKSSIAKSLNTSPYYYADIRTVRQSSASCVSWRKPK